MIDHDAIEMLSNKILDDDTITDINGKEHTVVSVMDYVISVEHLYEIEKRFSSLLNNLDVGSKEHFWITMRYNDWFSKVVTAYVKNRYNYLNL